MSLPTIPNITPIIDISREDALNMLIASIAMEEMGLAHIINAEGEKIQYVLKSEISRSASIHDIKDINQGIDRIIRDVTKLQMLLQEKLESVMILSEEKKECSCKHKPSPCPQPPSCHPPCALIGCGSGYIINKTDAFYGFTASVESSVCVDSENNVSFSLEYILSKKQEGTCRPNLVIMMAIPESIEVTCTNKTRPCNTSHDFNMLIMKGQGVMSIKETENNISQCTVSFTLTIWDTGCEQKLQMVISSKKLEFNHDSGIVLVSSGDLEIKNIPRKKHPLF
ncbi:hypothetical protein [Proteiniborus sp. MB09-C3]|uniref:hypothetical protein n=1 Tax=Proteiniborus sp. MB09-C3 TaxID=3050072 RepID=UPI00255513CC|nr:hypothetical protein [Proteiniborus sp. MB09-C3]WIV13751.1 hypothetical protein QO263_08655 [Proteiniborus sp. MB09-C3]